MDVPVCDQWVYMRVGSGRSQGHCKVRLEMVKRGENQLERMGQLLTKAKGEWVFYANDLETRAILTYRVYQTQSRSELESLTSEVFLYCARENV